MFLCFTSLQLAKDSDWLFHERNNPFREDIYFASDIILLENTAEGKIVKIMMNNGDRLIL